VQSIADKVDQLIDALKRFTPGPAFGVVSIETRR
jgi:hypothetical protein